MVQRPLNNWSQVVSAVSKAGLENRNKYIIENLRKQHYGNVLLNQIQERNIQMYNQRVSKQKELSKIVLDCHEEKRNYLDKKLSRKKIEQWYQMENLDLIKSHKNVDKYKNNQKEGQINQFFKLQDKEKKRKLQTRKNFQLQNLLNDRQMEIKNKQKTKQNNLKVYEKQMYNSYVQGQFQKIETDRQLWKNKYLYDKSIREHATNKDYGYAYQSFLRKQMEQKRRNQNQQRIDTKLKGINKSVDHPNSSPAYLGVSESFDRRKQLNVIDKHLNFSPIQSKNQIMIKKSNNSSQSSLYKIKDSLPQLNLKKQPSSQNQLSYSNRYAQNKLLIKQQKRKPQQYTSYDFISGTKKTFFA